MNSTYVDQGEDIHHYSRNLASARRRVAAEDFDEGDRKALLSFADYIIANGVSLGRVTKYLYHLTTIRREMTCNFGDLDRRKVEALMAWINGSEYKPWTRADMKGALKRFQKWLRNGNLDKDRPFPPEVAWITEKLKRNELEEPEVLNGEEAQRMVSAAPTVRDKALIAVAHEGGFRIGELLGIKLKDVAFDEYGARVSVKGKTGARTVRLITSSSLLARWIEEHGRNGDVEAPLWHTLATNGDKQRLSYGGAIKVIRSAAAGAGIKKRVYPHLFRHSAATRDASFLTEHQLMVKYGWTGDSRAPSRYVHLSSKDIDEKLISVYSGKPFDPPKPDFGPVICPRCSERNTPGLRFCTKCGTPLESSTLVKSGVETEDRLRRLEEENQTMMGALRDLLPLLEELKKERQDQLKGIKA